MATLYLRCSNCGKTINGITIETPVDLEGSDELHICNKCQLVSGLVIRGERWRKPYRV